MTKKVTVTLEVDNRFEPGHCIDCPLSYWESYHDLDSGESDDYNVCVLGSDWEYCPLEEID